MSAYRFHRETVVVATAKTAAEADMIKITLAAHGFQATVTPRFSAYPSVDFVEGVDVAVMAAEEAAVRELLDKLKLTGDPS